MRFNQYTFLTKLCFKEITSNLVKTNTSLKKTNDRIDDIERNICERVDMIEGQLENKADKRHVDHEISSLRIKIEQ